MGGKSGGHPIKFCFPLFPLFFGTRPNQKKMRGVSSMSQKCFVQQNAMKMPQRKGLSLSRKQTIKKPLTVKLLIDRWCALFLDRAFREALSQLNDGYIWYPGDPVLAELRGHTYSALGLYEEALGCYIFCLRYMCDNPILETEIARVLLHLGRESEALEHGKRALSLQPMNAHTLLVMAKINQKLGDWQEVRQHASLCLWLDPQNRGARELYTASKTIKEFPETRTSTPPTNTVAICTT
jgi:tetratricopeptide (TPR) repeat protein